MQCSKHAAAPAAGQAPAVNEARRHLTRRRLIIDGRSVGIIKPWEEPS